MNKFKVGDKTWKRVPGFDYKVSSEGDVISLKTGRLLKGGSYWDYKRITFIKIENGKKKLYSQSVHFLVARAFFGPRPPGMVINHKNGKKLDNRVSNLEYCTPRQNSEHAMAMRLYSSGSRCSWSKLSEEKVMCILAAKKIGMSHSMLAKAFGVSKKTILNISRGRIWKYAQETLEKKEASKKKERLGPVEEITVLSGFGNISTVKVRRVLD